MSPTEPEDDSKDRVEPTEIDRAENVKHLEFVQAIVARLANNSFFIKGWALTIGAASFGFAVNRVDWRVAAMGAFVVLGFWVLDSYYLRQERLFRHLYNHVRRNVATEVNERFSMNLLGFASFKTVKRTRVFFSATLSVYYGVIIISGATLAIVFAATAPVTPSAAATPTPDPAVTTTSTPSTATATPMRP